MREVFAVGDEIQLYDHSKRTVNIGCLYRINDVPFASVGCNSLAAGKQN